MGRRVQRRQLCACRVADKSMEDTGPENHPIQLRAINIGELHIRLNGAPDRSYSPSGEQFQLTPSWTEYDSEDKTVGVRVKIDIGDLETDSLSQFLNHRYRS